LIIESLSENRHILSNNLTIYSFFTGVSSVPVKLRFMDSIHYATGVLLFVSILTKEPFPNPRIKVSACAQLAVISVHPILDLVYTCEFYVF
jgi:hypothetical protein